MIELDRHIEILLLCNDCVIVPSLGGFMAHHVEAHFDAKEGLFLPPLRTLGFNSQLTINDSLLAQSYVEAYDISFPEAIRRIESEVSELKQILATDGKFELNDIGELSINEEGSYEFKPCEAGILSPDLYGLSSFDISKIQNLVTKEEPNDTIHLKKELPLHAIAHDDNVPSADTVLQTDDAITIHMHAFRNAIAIAAAIICFFIFTLPLGNSSSYHINQSSLNSGIINKVLSEKNLGMESSQVQAFTKNTQKPLTSKENATKQITQKKEKADTVNKTADEALYCLVLASRVTKKNAEAFVEKLVDEGYSDTHLYIKGNTLRVVYGHYPSKSKAYKELNRLHDRSNFEDAWVYKK